MLTILNTMPLACAEWSIDNTQVSFVMALGGVPVKEFFNDVGYWRRKRVPWLVNPPKAHKSNCGEHT